MTELIHAQSETTVRPFPLARTGCPMQPAPEYAVLRETEPVSRVKLTFNGREAWLLTRFEDMQQMLRDPVSSRTSPTPATRSSSVSRWSCWSRASCSGPCSTWTRPCTPSTA